jgi:RNA polymerase sigma-70 factor, ECF subfamily
VGHTISLSADRPEAESAATTSDSLLEGVKEGDRESWSRIVRLYTPLVLSWCRRRGLYGPRGEDAQDVIQEVFKTVALRIKTFNKDGNPGAFRRWLYTITDIKLREYWGHKRNESPAAGGNSAQNQLRQLPEPALDSSDADISSDRAILVRRALELTREKFEPRTWEVMWQVVVEGRYAQDVALEFGMKVGAVYKAKSVVLSRLRKEYEGILT